MGAANLLKSGQRLLQNAFPAVIQVNGQTYDCATSGLRREMTLSDGPSEISRRVSFWLPLKRFTDAGQPIPGEQAPLIWDGVEYTIESVLIDPAKVNVTLSCVEKPQ